VARRSEEEERAEEMDRFDGDVITVTATVSRTGCTYCGLRPACRAGRGGKPGRGAGDTKAAQPTCC